jgi:hypothetical protein
VLRTALASNETPIICNGFKDGLNGYTYLEDGKPT